MTSVLQSLVGICTVMAAAEAASRLCSENAMVKFVHSLAVLVLITSLFSSLPSVDWDLRQPMERAEAAGGDLTEYLEQETAETAGKELESYLDGLLRAANLTAEKIETFTDIGRDGSIELTKVKVSFRYASDAERAGALLRNVLGEETEVEVETDGR